MKLKAIQMLALTLGVMTAWSVRKAMREGKNADPATLGDAGGKAGEGGQAWSPALQTASGVTEYDDADADPPRNRMPSVGDLPP
ncbi:MAG: hypothetical protein GAK35_01380 [Herbaspirillum frisingense]|uniref:Uncharacterized protein n=1 Tax=Herbaspirillum frisingense TaxID=92645 RepID=A0A7V8JV66_9BURK|nr:MAG: hypothetical protein GAK35_01380 [Herbaspirillum frisingense]